jgi:cysteine-rich repeat protein
VQGEEQCDDQNDVTTDECVACIDAFCGDGFIHVGVEQCDDGENVPDDGCDANCFEEFCGDGFTNDTDEQCDDGDADPGDGCDANCNVEFCGDGLFNNTGSEECDGTAPDENPTCADLGFFLGGIVTCDDACQLDTSDCEKVSSVVFSEGETVVSALFYSTAVTINIVARDANGQPIAATCEPSGQSFVVPTPVVMTPDGSATANCTTTSTGLGVNAALSLHPLAAQAKSLSQLFDPSILPQAIDLVDVTAAADGCVYTSAAPTGRAEIISVACTRGDQTVNVPEMNVGYQVKFELTPQLGLNSASALVFEVTTLAAESCLVRCASAGTPTSITANGTTVDVAVGSLSPGDTTCAVECSNEASGTAFAPGVTVHNGDISNAAALSLLSSDVAALQGAILVGQGSDNLGAQTIGHNALQVVTGDLTISDGVNGGFAFLVAFPALREVGALNITSADDLQTLLDSDGIPPNDPSFPVLRSVGAAVNISSNPELTAIAFPALQSVGTVSIQQNSVLTSVTFAGTWSLIGAIFQVDNNVPLTCTLADALLCAANPNPPNAAVDISPNGGVICTPTAACVN